MTNIHFKLIDSKNNEFTRLEISPLLNSLNKNTFESANSISYSGPFSFRYGALKKENHPKLDYCLRLTTNINNKY